MKSYENQTYIKFFGNFKGVVATVWPITIPPIGTKGDYDYNKVLHASLLFYEAQRSGKLPADNRIHWRGDSMLDDKGSAGEDLSGGYYDGIYKYYFMKNFL
jgi:hypothetical protein